MTTTRIPPPPPPPRRPAGNRPRHARRQRRLPPWPQRQDPRGGTSHPTQRVPAGVSPLCQLPPRASLALGAYQPTEACETRIAGAAPPAAAATAAPAGTERTAGAHVPAPPATASNARESGWKAAPAASAAAVPAGTERTAGARVPAPPATATNVREGGRQAAAASQRGAASQNIRRCHASLPDLAATGRLSSRSKAGTVSGSLVAGAEKRPLQRHWNDRNLACVVFKPGPAEGLTRFIGNTRARLRCSTEI